MPEMYTQKTVPNTTQREWSPRLPLVAQAPIVTPCVRFCSFRESDAFTRLPSLCAGLYLVSAGTDQLLVLWDVGLRKALCQRSTPSTVTAVSWHPQDNSLACMSEEGSVAVWDGIVPEGHPGPHISPDSLLAQGVTSPQEGGGERGGSVDPTSGFLLAACEQHADPHDHPWIPAQEPCVCVNMCMCLSVCLSVCACMHTYLCSNPIDAGMSLHACLE